MYVCLKARQNKKKAALKELLGKIRCQRQPHIKSCIFAVSSVLVIKLRWKKFIDRSKLEEFSINSDFGKVIYNMIRIIIFCNLFILKPRLKIFERYYYLLNATTKRLRV